MIAVDDLPEGARVAGAALVLRWRLEVEPGGRVQLGWTVWADEAPVADEAAARRELTIDPGPPPVVDEADGTTAYEAWRAGMAAVESDNELFDRLIERSVADLRLLLNDGPRPDEHYLAAGVPWFATLFGRDAIIAAYEAIAFRPDLAVATLEVLAARQAVVDDPRTDAEPGKILHEVRTGEMARTGELPFATYYGSVDATPLWLILLGETHDWTGDDALVDRLWPNALAALSWIDRYGDLDGDGFVEYRRRAELGLINQGWKDSTDAIRDREGRTAEPPVALAEVQGYVHDAKRRMARLARHRGESDLADRLEREADELRSRFNEAFWMADGSRYAMALDRDKRPMDALASNMGQALWGGIVDPARASAVVGQLSGPALDSGWGVRTYARRAARLQPARLPHRLGLAARQRPDRGGDQALRLRPRGERAGRPDLRGRPAVPGPAPARALLRLRPARGRRPGPLPRRLLAAGLVGRGLAPARPDDVRRPGERGGPDARARPAAPADVARQADGHQPAGRRRVGRPALPSLARDDERRGPPQVGRPRGHDPGLTPLPSAIGSPTGARCGQPRRTRA